MADPARPKHRSCGSCMLWPPAEVRIGMDTIISDELFLNHLVTAAHG